MPPMGSQEERAAARVGTTLRGKYRLERVLGVGGMAAVYAAVHCNNASRVAVKVLHPELSGDPSTRARFQREGYAANSIGHAAAVRVLDDDVAEDGAAFLVMELLEGETLDARAKRLGGRLPVREALALGRALLDALAAAHEKGIVHRDVKPENLFLTTERALKILDFGIARVRDAPAAHTWTGAAMGTPAFMPPEQALGRTDEVDARTDVWAAGATLFRLLSGAFVHEGRSGAEVVVHAATKPARSLGDVAP
ncbi:MAG TPA: serine/threonine-protein kinase, partial [Minicystis sp.]|nr:serine/threonine-protein kinase [Minicystis sp.]